MHFAPMSRIGVALVCLFFLASVDASAQLRKKNRIDPAEAQATSEAPVSTQVEQVSFPYDPNLPYYVVVVEPFDYSASGQTSGGGQGAPTGAAGASGQIYTVANDGTIRTTFDTSYAPQIGQGIAKQLMTALGRWPNVALIEPDAIARNGDGTYNIKLQPGEVGPFIVRGTITEFMETAEAEGKQKGFNSRRLGLATGLIGGIAGNRGVAAAGAGVAVAGPEFNKEEMKRTGMVGMDVRIIDGRIARILPGGAFNSAGSFTSIAKGADFNMLGFSTGREQSAASSLGQATRAAMNDAVTKIHQALQRARVE